MPEGEEVVHPRTLAPARLTPRRTPIRRQRRTVDGISQGLHELGVCAPTHVQTFRLQHSQRFASMDEAMEHFRHQYNITTAEQEAIVRDHLGRVLKEENGCFGLPASSIRVKIWWETGSEEDGLGNS